VAGSGRADRPGSEDSGEGIGAVIRQLLSQPRMRRGLSLGLLTRSWADVVGENLARETAPVRLEGGALVVAASTAAWGTQVRFLAEDVARRANQTLGSEEVRSVRVVVSSEARKPLRRNDSGP
jgi:hypothetical protein